MKNFYEFLNEAELDTSRYYEYDQDIGFHKPYERTEQFFYDHGYEWEEVVALRDIDFECNSDAQPMLYWMIRGILNGGKASSDSPDKYEKHYEMYKNTNRGQNGVDVSYYDKPFLIAAARSYAHIQYLEQIWIPKVEADRILHENRGKVHGEKFGI